MVAESGIAPSAECPLLISPDTADITPSEESFAKHAEFKILMTIALPLALTLLVAFGQGVVDLAFVGHVVGIDALTAASLATLWMNVTSVFIPRGLNAAMSALCSQASGAKNMPLVGVWLVNGLFLQTLALVPVMGAWWCTDSVLEAAGIRPLIAEMAATFARWSMLYLYPSIIYQAVSVWASAQRIVLHRNHYVDACTCI